MGFWDVLLIAVGLAMDAFAVSIASGIVIREARISHALKFGVLFGGFQLLMPLLGWLLSVNFAKEIAAFDHWIAFVLLAFIGGKMLLSARRSEEEPMEEAQLLSAGNMLLLALATSIDALAAGIGIAVTGANICSAASVIGVVAFGFSFCGVLLGKQMGALAGKRVELLGGLILIGIGLKILVEHLLF